jgi:hypothetical protein
MLRMTDLERGASQDKVGLEASPFDFAESPAGSKADIWAQDGSQDALADGCRRARAA